MISKIKQLETYVRYMGVFGTHHVTVWGANNHCNEPTRLMRRMHERGLIAELSPQQKHAIGRGQSGEKWWYYRGQWPLEHNKDKYKTIGVDL